MICAVCAARLVYVDVGKLSMWVHAEGRVGQIGHAAQPKRVR